MSEHMPTLDDASDALATAAALGMNVPAPEGTYAYKLMVTPDGGSDPVSLGIYATHNYAMNALTDWILQLWQETWYQPWAGMYLQIDGSEEEHKKDWEAWLAQQSAQDIVTLWKSLSSGARFDIYEVTIQSYPHTRAGKKTADD